MTTIVATATIAPHCEASVGFYPGDYGTLPLWCSARIALTTWTDTQGTVHRACRHHLGAMQRRWTPLPEGTELDAGSATFDEPERVARVVTEASAPLRRFERQVVVESGPGWIATADVEDDPPEHDHFDIWDSTDTCPRCAWDQLRAEG